MDYLKLFSGQNILKKSVLYGGKDITGVVLLYILEKRKVPRVRRRQIIAAFKRLYGIKK
jgi:hypothetical protein